MFWDWDLENSPPLEFTLLSLRWLPPVRPFPYADDEVIGGESLNTINQRLWSVLQAKKHAMGKEMELKDYQFTRIQAEDLFEVKVEIIQIMAGLDPTGNFVGKGARAFHNSRTATGEEPLERLYALLEDLNRGGVQSEAFKLLQDKVVRRHDLDSHSET